MRLSTLSILASAGSAPARRPDGTPMCDYYAQTVVGSNTAESQHTLLNWIVNRFAFGGFTFPDGRNITGFLHPGKYQGHDVNLLPYFNGGLASLNQGGTHGVAVNMLKLAPDGLYPQKPTMTPNGTNINQNIHLTHVYPYFGQVLECSKIGQDGYPAYVGPASTYEVHKFMYLDRIQIGYFIEQIALSAESFGFSKADAARSTTIFDRQFNWRCSPAETIVPHQGPQYNSLCQNPSCPLAEDPDCPEHQPGPPPSVNLTLSFGQGQGFCTDCGGDGDEIIVKPETLTYPVIRVKNSTTNGTISDEYGANSTGSVGATGATDPTNSTSSGGSTGHDSPVVASSGGGRTIVAWTLTALVAVAFALPLYN